MNVDWAEMILETLGMTFVSTFLAYLVGLPLGVLLKITSVSGLHPNRPVNIILGTLVNFLRSIPCLILLIILLPLTRTLLGRGTGAWYVMIIPLFFSTFAFVARNVEQSLQDVDEGAVEAVRSLGANKRQIVMKVYIPEARSSLLLGFALTLVNVIGYTSFAYNVGAGGVISELYSLYRGHTLNFTELPEFWIMVAVVVIMVTIIQEVGILAAKKLDKRKKAL